jgi:hypothetical protein
MLEELEISVQQRVRNGARWLDENFPGWMDRINLDTLALDDANTCICGQVFNEDAKEWNNDMKGFGYWYAEKTLFSEANAWILGSVPKRDDGTYDPRRANLVSQFLGFNTIGNECDGECDPDGDECSCEGFDILQSAWIDLLLARGLVETV